MSGCGSIGAFLIPYAVMVVVLGIPLFMLESSLGQFASLGATAVFKISPLWKGLGYAMVLICWCAPLIARTRSEHNTHTHTSNSHTTSHERPARRFISLYYNVVIAECLYFLFASFSFPELPWTHCNPEWASPSCRDRDTLADAYSDAAGARAQVAKFIDSKLFSFHSTTPSELRSLKLLFK